MSNLSLKLSKEQIQKLKDTFKDDIKPNPNEYIDTFIQKEKVTISIYKSDKVVFQGEDALFYGTSFIDTKFNRQAGSDEVGTGDYFGPVVVCASILEESDKELIDQYQITDSKQMDDETILKIGKELMNKVKHSLLILDNVKYNEVHKTNNLNQIKAKLHNQAYINLINKGYKLPGACYVDDFCGEYNYYNYLQNEKDVYHSLIFETKAESKYPAVAISSVIARYAFLKKMEELSDKYEFFFHKGAGEEVDKDIKRFVERFGKDELNKVAKIHFKNTEVIHAQEKPLL